MSPLFLAVSLISFFVGAGFAVAPKASVMYGVFIIAVYPTGHYMAETNSFSGTYFYDYYVAGLIVSIILAKSLSARLVAVGAGPIWASLRTRKMTLVKVSAIVIPYFFVGIMSGFDKYDLLDLRPLLTIVAFVALDRCVSSQRHRITERTVLWIFIWASLGVAIKFGISFLGVYVSSDEYYAEGAYRYLDGGTYLCAIYIVNYLCMKGSDFQNRRLALLVLLLCFAVVLISNSRLLLFAVLVCPLLVGKMALHKRVFAGFMALLGAALFLFISIQLDVDRVTESLSVSGITSELYARFEPAWVKIVGMSWWNVLLGLGSGSTFYIPWFAYRGLDTTSATIDGGYLVYFVKYGLVGLPLLILFIRSAVAGLAPRSRHAASWVLWVMLLTSTTPYHPYAIGIGLGAILLSANQLVRKSVPC